MFHNSKIELDTARSYARGLAAGLLFGVPLLFTMEMWWLGFSLAPEQLLMALFANFIILLIFENYSGFRENTTFVEESQDAIVAQGLGMIVSVLMLWLLNRIRADMSVSEILGKVIMQTVSISIGISVAMTMLGQKKDNEGVAEERRKDEAGYWGNQAIALAGSIFFALNVAATEEPLMMGMQAQPWQTLALLLLSVALVFAITYALEFQGGIEHAERKSWWAVFARDSASTWATAFLCAASLLFLFNRIDTETGLLPAIQTIIALTFATSLGAAAARILI